MPKVESSNLAALDWNHTNGGMGTLTAEFKGGEKYEYYEVPGGIYQKMIDSPSVGAYFDTYIKKAGYGYKKLRQPSDIEVWCEDNLFGDRFVQGQRIPLSDMQKAVLGIAVDIIKKWESREK